ncbi:MAG TPA: hypothetical protein VFZ00_34440 [Solirubrobacter sp.]|nr:hypothetical protein [Solirubrobacter sp.]
MDNQREPFPDQGDPDYARGLDHEAPPGPERENQFSEGQEQLPSDTPEKLDKGSFAEGQEDRPHVHEDESDFARGQEEDVRRP